MYKATSYLRHRKKAVTIIQAIARGARQRPIYREELKEWKENRLLENRLILLQKRLEEAEKGRIDAEKKAQEPKTVVVYKEAQEKKNDDRKISAQHQTLMDESGNMLEYLRKEVFKLRYQNPQIKTDFELVKENNKRLMDANASVGASFQDLNQHAKQITKTNSKVVIELNMYKQQVSKLHQLS